MKWKLVPVDVVTGEMVAAGIATPVANTGNDTLDRPEDYKQVFLSMLEVAPKPEPLTDERILEIHRDVLRGDAGGNRLQSVILMARAIEREILGGGE